MASITTRAGKGSPLTHAEVDANFNNLNDGKLDISTAPAGSIAVSAAGNTSIGTGTGYAKLEVHGAQITHPLFSATTGPVLAYNTTNNADTAGTLTALSVVRAGKAGVSYGNHANFNIGRYSQTGFAANTQLTLRLTQGNQNDPDTDVMTWLGNGKVGVGTTSPEYLCDIAGSVAQVGYSTDAYIQYKSSGGNWHVGTSGSGFTFYSGTYGSGTYRARIDSSGRLLIGVSTTGVPNSGFYVDPNGSSKIGNNAGVDGWGFIDFGRSGVSIGTITQSGTTGVAYNTTSDYRLKENITAVTDGIARLQQLKPSRFNFIADPDRTVDGFIAHEAADVVPESVTGEKDATDEDGQPIYQGIDQSKMVPLLTAALQEAVQRIETLEAKVAALEAA